MVEFRCRNCGKLLGKLDGGIAEIKCPRCGTINTYNNGVPKSANGKK